MQEYEELLKAFSETLEADYAMLKSLAPAMNQELKSDKWTRKEIIGHLMDSCSNNYQRILRGFNGIDDAFFPYDQDVWVALQKYNDCDANDLVQTWYYLNKHLFNLFKSMEHQRDNVVSYSNGKTMNLTALFEDYQDHLKHHIAQIMSK